MFELLDNLDFLKDAFPRGQELPLRVLFERVALALVLGLAVAIVYRLTHRNDATNSSGFVATLVLLSILIAVMTLVVGDTLARAFSLVGILSIVRFRAAVDDIRDTAFVIFAVVVGMASGLGNLTVALVGMAAVSVAAFGLFWFQRLVSKTAPDIWVLNLRVGTSAGSETPWESLFAKHCDFVQLQSTATARQGAALDLAYKLCLKPGVTPLQFLNELNRIDGIQNLELKRG
jgi:Domain of unknown function (DUF4956)